MRKPKIKKALFKEIKLLPTKFSVDVWICDNLELIAKCYNKRYGASQEYYKEETKPNCVWSITSTDESELKGDKTIVMCVESWDMPIIVHELNHVIYHLAKYCHLETNYDSQEWISYMLEYLFEQCQNDGSFKPYDI